METKDSPTSRDLVIAALIALGVAAAFLMDTRVESRAYEPTPAVHTVQWSGGAAAGPSPVAATPALSGAARKR